MKNIVILGSTGSIGTQTLEVIASLPDYNLLAISAYRSIDLFYEQIKEFAPAYSVLADKEAVPKLKQKMTGKTQNTKILGGLQGVSEIAALREADLVVNALVGAVGLEPSLACLKAGNQLALANKESMVIGGPLLNSVVRENNDIILPIDSEHNAVFQLIDSHNREVVKKIYLTASGGPFLHREKEQLKQVTVDQALDHPNWDMGPKITIDSATMFNKGLEVIEAHYLFGLPFSDIEVVVHPQSVVHSLVELVDNSFHAEMGSPDMKHPIQFVLTYPERQIGCGQRLDLLSGLELEFMAPDRDKFPALDLAYKAGRNGGTMPAVLNATNEVAVAAFLNKRIAFVQIPDIIELVLEKHNNIIEPQLEDILEVDSWARKIAEEVIGNAAYNN